MNMFAAFLINYRRYENLTQQQLGDLLGVPRLQITKWEHGTEPDLAQLVAIADRLDVSLDELLDREFPKPTKTWKEPN